MPKINFKQFTVYALVILVFFIPFFGLFFVAIQSQQKAFEVADQEILASHGRQLIQYMESSLIKVAAAEDMIAVFAVQNQGNLDDFDAIVRQVLLKYPLIRSINIAPKGVIAKTYPVESSQRIEGFDLLNSPQHGDKIRQSQRSSKPIMLGPLELAPDNWGMVGYLPVVTDKGEFWGFITLTIKLSEAFKLVEIENIIGPDFFYRLGRFDTESSEVSYFSSNMKTVPKADKKTFSFDMQGIWRIDLMLKQGHPRNVLAFWIAGGLSLFVSALGLILYEKSRKNKVLHKYDSALGCPNRFDIIMKADEALSGINKWNGLSVVVVISTDEFKQDQHTLDVIRSKISSSLRSKDLLFPIDQSHYMAIIVGLSSMQLAEEVTEKLFKKIQHHRESIGLSGSILKMGACIKTRQTRRTSAITNALEALRLAYNQPGDALEISVTREGYKQ